jgi:ORF6N domain
MLSSTLAELYEVEVRALIQATKRNLDRFPEDFMFKLNPEEVEALRSQNVILELKGKGRYPKYPPYAFTQEGVASYCGVVLVFGYPSCLNLNPTCGLQLLPVLHLADGFRSQPDFRNRIPIFHQLPGLHRV